MNQLQLCSVGTCILRSVDCSCSRDIFSDPTFLQIDSVKAALSVPNDFVDRSADAGSDGFTSISMSIEFGFMLK